MSWGTNQRGHLTLRHRTLIAKSAEVEVPQELSVCETDSLPTAFTLTCTTSVTANSLVWVVTGLNTIGSRTIAGGDSQGAFNYPPSTREGEAALMVNDPANMEVVEGTCFQCRDLISNTISTAAYVNVTCE